MTTRKRDLICFWIKGIVAGVPLYIGEWNNVVRTKEGGVFKINPGASDFTNSNAGKILEAFKKEGVWGTLFGSGIIGMQIRPALTWLMMRVAN